MDVLQAVFKSLILSNLAGIEGCNAVEVATVGVASVVTTCVVVAVAANKTEFPEDETVLELAPWLEAGGTLELDAPETTVLVGAVDWDIATVTAVVITEAVDAAGWGFWGVLHLLPRFGISRPAPSVRSCVEVWFNPAKVWSSPEKSKFACDWSKAADSSRGDFAAGEPHSDELALEDESWPSAGSP
jgi:hypothetical protein